VRSTKSRSWTEGPFGHLLGFAPIGVPGQVFALTAGPAPRLRYAAFAREAGGWRLVDGREAALAADAFQHGPLGGPLRDPVAFGELLGGLLQRVAAPVKDASLVIPDAWLRVTFAESGDLPPQPAARDEVLRWKLKRLVPFRVDELRLSGEEVEPFPGQQEPRRVLLGFAVEALLSQLEQVFEAQGVRLGAIANPSLSLLGALRPSADDALTTVALVDDQSYTLLFARPAARGLEPVLHRYKAWTGDPSEAARASLVARDLRLTRTFLEENLPGVRVAEALLLTAPQTGDDWLGWLREGLGCPARPLAAEQLGALAGGLPAGVFSWPLEAAPLLGAACREVA
jgi:hypothetical protein